MACARPTAGPRWNRLCRRTPDWRLEPPTIFSWPVPARRSDSATRCDTRHTPARCRCLSPRADHPAARTRDARLSRPRMSLASAALVLPEAKPARNAAAVAPVLRRAVFRSPSAQTFFFFFLSFFLRRAKTHHRIRQPHHPFSPATTTTPCYTLSLVPFLPCPCHPNPPSQTI